MAPPNELLELRNILVEKLNSVAKVNTHRAIELFRVHEIQLALDLCDPEFLNHEGYLQAYDKACKIIG